MSYPKAIDNRSDRLTACVHVRHRLDEKKISALVNKSRTDQSRFQLWSVSLTIEIDYIEPDVVSAQRVFNPWVSQSEDGLQSFLFSLAFCFVGGSTLFPCHSLQHLFLFHFLYLNTTRCYNSDQGSFG